MFLVLAVKEFANVKQKMNLPDALSSSQANSTRRFSLTFIIQDGGRIALRYRLLCV